MTAHSFRSFTSIGASIILSLIVVVYDARHIQQVYQYLDQLPDDHAVGLTTALIKLPVAAVEIDENSNDNNNNNTPATTAVKAENTNILVAAHTPTLPPMIRNDDETTDTDRSYVSVEQTATNNHVRTELAAPLSENQDTDDHMLSVDTAAPSSPPVPHRIAPWTSPPAAALFDQHGNRLPPPLSSLVNDTDHIIGDPQFLFDFAIIGFGKCGTTTMMSWLGDHPEVYLPQAEDWSLVYQDPQGFIRRHYANYIPGPYQRGYKCPGDIRDHTALQYLRTLWPRTKLLIGIRHPVLWFQSLYNFRVQNYDDMLPPHELMGRCKARHWMTCTEMGNFALDLLRLGKQNVPTPRITTDLEKKILRYHGKRRYARISYNATRMKPLPNEVFLYDVAQLEDENATRLEKFKRDLQLFLGLSQPLPAEVHHRRPGRKVNDTALQAKKDAQKIDDICRDKYKDLRRELMEIARLNGEWIRDVFVHLPGIHVSSPSYFRQLMTDWINTDPCGAM